MFRLHLGMLEPAGQPILFMIATEYSVHPLLLRFSGGLTLGEQIQQRARPRGGGRRVAQEADNDGSATLTQRAHSFHTPAFLCLLQTQ